MGDSAEATLNDALAGIAQDPYIYWREPTHSLRAVVRSGTLAQTSARPVDVTVGRPHGEATARPVAAFSR